MKYYLGVTDNHWYSFLSLQQPEDVNFWQPGGTQKFGVLSQGAPFLFKLKSPINAIGGVGFFASHSFTSLTFAWDTFGLRNGCEDFYTFQKLILSYRNKQIDLNPTIGCIVLTDPIFFHPDEWIETPENWSKSIVQGKSYETSEAIGRKLWDKVQILIQKYMADRPEENIKSPLVIAEPSEPLYGLSILRKVRIGQGAFRIMVTDAYDRKCSITGEKTLPVLEAAHIKPYANSGPNSLSNGILMRSDLHKLFDSGYITVTQDHTIEVSKRIREEFQNGKEYYRFHGNSLITIPSILKDQPDEFYLNWHNNNVFKK